MVVPKKLVGIRFCVDGVPGRNTIVTVAGMASRSPGKIFFGMSASRNSAIQMGYMVKAITNTPIPP